MHIGFRERSLADAANRAESGTERWGSHASDVRVALACLRAIPALEQAGDLFSVDESLAVFKGRRCDVWIRFDMRGMPRVLPIVAIDAVERRSES